jgi:hypothetical protein
MMEQEWMVDLWVQQGTERVLQQVLVCAMDEAAAKRRAKVTLNAELDGSGHVVEVGDALRVKK